MHRSIGPSLAPKKAAPLDSPCQRGSACAASRAPDPKPFEDEADALQLRFYCHIGLRGREPNGPEEQAEQVQFEGDRGYKAALLSTLQRTRELLAEGRL